MFNIFSQCDEPWQVSTLVQTLFLLVENNNIMGANKPEEMMLNRLGEHILTKEGEGWMNPNEIALAADMYVANLGVPRPKTMIPGLFVPREKRRHHIKCEDGETKTEEMTGEVKGEGDCPPNPTQGTRSDGDGMGWNAHTWQETVDKHWNTSKWWHWHSLMNQKRSNVEPKIPYEVREK